MGHVQCDAACLVQCLGFLRAGLAATCRGLGAWLRGRPRRCRAPALGRCRDQPDADDLRNVCGARDPCVASPGSQ
eukprot:9521993-Alexandrium_andersonii.AAC.1